jgi:hypothetical protein
MNGNHADGYESGEYEDTFTSDKEYQTVREQQEMSRQQNQLLA